MASPWLSEAVCNWVCEHRDVAGRLGRLVRPELSAPLAEDRVEHTYRSYSQTLAKVIVSAGAAGSIGDVAIPIHLVAGADDDLVDRQFLRRLAERHPHRTPTNDRKLMVAAARTAMSRRQPTSASARVRITPAIALHPPVASGGEESCQWASRVRLLP